MYWATLTVSLNAFFPKFRIHTYSSSSLSTVFSLKKPLGNEYNCFVFDFKDISRFVYLPTPEELYCHVLGTKMLSLRIIMSGEPQIIIVYLITINWLYFIYYLNYSSLFFSLVLCDIKRYLYSFGVVSIKHLIIYKTIYCKV